MPQNLFGSGAQSSFSHDDPWTGIRRSGSSSSSASPYPYSSDARGFLEDELVGRENVARTQAGAQLGAAGMQSSTAYARMHQDRQRFNQVLSLLQGQMSRTGQPVAVGGGDQPAITAGPIWDPQQIQEQVNAARGGIDAQTGTRMRGAAQQTAGRGFGGSRSPLLMALQGRIQGQGMAAGADAERGIRWDSAEGNAGHQLKGQMAQESQFAARRAEEIERQRVAQSGMNALLQALSGLA